MICSFWPPRGTFRVNGTNPGGVISDRLGQNDPQGALLSYNVNPNQGFNANGFNGRAGATIGSTIGGAPNGMQLTFQPWVVIIGTRGAAGVPSMAGFDAFGAYSIEMLAAFVNPAAPLAATIDNGLELCTSGSIGIDDGCAFLKGNPGFGFRVSDVGTVQAFVRSQAAGAIVQQTLLTTAANGYVPSDWHSYKLVVVGAQGATEAVCKWFIDGILKFSRSWGAAAEMPIINVNTAGFRVNVGTNGGSALGFVVDQIVFRAAKDELNLL
jgi:hypothetical protein